MKIEPKGVPDTLEAGFERKRELRMILKIIGLSAGRRGWIRFARKVRGCHHANFNESEYLVEQIFLSDTSSTFAICGPLLFQI